ncbi:CDG_1a_G0027830.mRNA.1.CDS.1 [Saccharomyces cerevisiae]|nr:CDG_1a_G0027830.mRNA.1.CDS.1 [Saccharomyces cerevisiae]CAI7249017.1 CDG_1a_G0027830.mRNA.1.CDS.1 [Saccharomyces cerevisiae]
MKVSDRRKFEKANFDEFESALNNKNDLVHCPSITLFESIPTEVRSFYEDEKSGLIKVVKFRTGAMDRKRSFEKVVISVMVGKNVKKFLTFVEDEPDFQGGPIPSNTNASAKEDTNKDGNAEDNRFHPVTDINKESYKRKGSQMVLLERKKLKAQFPNTSENMNVLQFLGFRSDEIKHLFLYGIDIYFCPEGVFTQYGLCKGCQKMFELCVCWAGQKVAYRRIAWEALAVERMLRNDEEYKEYLEDIEPYHGDPVGYLKYFSVKRREIYSQIQRNYAWYLAITRRRETISVLDSTRGKQGSQVFRMSGRQIKELYFKVWSNLRESKTEVLQYFLNWDEKSARKNGRQKTIRSLWKRSRKLEFFSVCVP